MIGGQWVGNEARHDAVSSEKNKPQYLLDGSCYCFLSIEYYGKFWTKYTNLK